MYSIYIVEDDQQIATLLGQHLGRYGYDVTYTNKFDEVKTEVIEHSPDLILLDINLPYFDGFHWCRQIRTFSNVPVIFISARTDEMNQVLAIEHGGDDYITKPFHLDVVTAKIKSALRRTYGEYANNTDSEQKEINGLIIYPNKNEVEFKQSRIELSKKEFLLFAKLIAQPDQIVSRDDLLESLWDEVDFVDDNTLSVNVNRVRKRLHEIGIVDAIHTVRGQGYRLRVNW
ncbi:response regulator transcription factor [Geomicrobium sediminis]|uniref:DNA-binding response OmpR family regulator n=1 Tax=Geomicrobium sediminis TaxID=1347788 RepID=A0ABS2PH30_9BACL|nr:response regulator transcription factor [Geomicrobium sediminis]MBM7634345.1 DNA-binding response OmpR family regulator [Geomicrobium sediminis]